jgi:hypothetical protein
MAHPPHAARSVERQRAGLDDGGRLRRESAGVSRTVDLDGPGAPAVRADRAKRAAESGSATEPAALLSLSSERLSARRGRGGGRKRIRPRGLRAGAGNANAQHAVRGGHAHPDFADHISRPGTPDVRRRAIVALHDKTVLGRASDDAVDHLPSRRRLTPRDPIGDHVAAPVAVLRADDDEVAVVVLGLHARPGHHHVAGRTSESLGPQKQKPCDDETRSSPPARPSEGQHQLPLLVARPRSTTPTARVPMVYWQRLRVPGRRRRQRRRVLREKAVGEDHHHLGMPTRRHVEIGLITAVKGGRLGDVLRPWPAATQGTTR